MKWLFAVLVALNIIVFGGMVASSVADKQKQAPEPAMVAATPQEKPAAAEQAANKPAEAVAAAASSVPNEAASAAIAAADEEAAKREQQAREAARLARERKVRQENAKRENMQNGIEPASAKGRQCSATATIVMNEDDYHRIKGLLNKWPHAATRTIEKRQGPAAPAPVVTSKTYRVMLPSDGDTISQMGSLAAKGFNGSLYNGDISVAVLQSQPSAQALIARLAGAGFGGAFIREQGGTSAPAGDRSLSVSRMQVLFMSVDDKDAQAIQAIVGQYGKLNRNVCR